MTRGHITSLIDVLLGFSLSLSLFLSLSLSLSLSLTHTHTYTHMPGVKVEAEAALEAMRFKYRELLTLMDDMEKINCDIKGETDRHSKALHDVVSEVLSLSLSHTHTHTHTHR